MTASRMPPTAETSPKPAASSGSAIAPLVTRAAAAAGVTTSAITRSAPMMCTATATTSPSSSMNPRDTATVGTPRAAADCGSSESKRRGRQIISRATSTNPQITISQPSWAFCTETIWPVSSENRLALRPL